MTLPASETSEHAARAGAVAPGAGRYAVHESYDRGGANVVRENRPEEARHWNLLTDMRVENLVHALRDQIPEPWKSEPAESCEILT